MDIKTATPKTIDTRLGEISEGRWPIYDRVRAARLRLATETEPARIERAENGCAKATAALDAYNAENEAEENALNAEFVSRGRWTRYYLVPGGHFHRSTACSTCRPTTRFGWVPEMSDKDEAVAIEAYGHEVCTVCFPDAPVLGARIDPSLCEHSGEYVRPVAWGASAASKYNKCECGNHSQLTSTGKIRKHKPGKN